MAEQFEDDFDLELEDEMTIDELAQHWAQSIPRRDNLKLVQLPREQVRRFLGAAQINPGTVAAAQKLQTRLKFSASVINVPAKPMLELCEAFITTQKASPANSLAKTTGQPTLNAPSSSEPAPLAAPIAPNAPVSTIAASLKAPVVDPADASEGQKTP